MKVTFQVNLTLSNNTSLPCESYELTGLTGNRFVFVPDRRGGHMLRRHGDIFALHDLDAAYLRDLVLSKKIDGLVIIPNYINVYKATTDFGSTDDEIWVLAVQTNGQIIAGGWTYTDEIRYDFALARYNPDGTLDATFGNGGKVITNLGTDENYLRSLVLQPDGKIVAGGRVHNGAEYDFALIRYNNDGSVDMSYGNNGVVITSFNSAVSGIYSLALQGDGKIVAGGRNYTNNSHYDFALARYNPDGSLDTSFGANGLVITTFADIHKYRIGRTRDGIYSIALQADGKIVAGGRAFNNFALARYNTDGSIDNTFGTNGQILTSFGTDDDFLHSLIVQPDQKIVAGGRTHPKGYIFALARYNTDGSLDDTFGNNGQVTTDFQDGSGDDEIWALTLDATNRIVAAGQAGTNFALARYSGVDGSLDTDMGLVVTDLGSASTGIYALCMQPNQQIVAGGMEDTDFVLVRYRNDGTIDPTFGDLVQVIEQDYS